MCSEVIPGGVWGTISGAIDLMGISYMQEIVPLYYLFGPPTDPLAGYRGEGGCFACGQPFLNAWHCIGSPRHGQGCSIPKHKARSNYWSLLGVAHPTPLKKKQKNPQFMICGAIWFEGEWLQLAVLSLYCPLSAWGIFLVVLRVPCDMWDQTHW